MILTRIASTAGPLWTVDGFALPPTITLGSLLRLSAEELQPYLTSQIEGASAIETNEVLAPVEADHEVWASGVTYLRSRVEREAESSAADVYAKVYDAVRPELFFKSVGYRVVGHGENIRIRRDSTWNVPEPELTLVINRFAEVVGYTVGNDVSSRSIEGENPLYLPQAKTYDGACALGPSIILAEASELTNLPIHLSISRRGVEVFAGEANTSQMKRTLEELVEHLTREITFPNGVFLLTGTCIVPGAEFTMMEGDVVSITVGDLTLVNEVATNS